MEGARASIAAYHVRGHGVQRPHGVLHALLHDRQNGTQQPAILSILSSIRQRVFWTHLFFRFFVQYCVRSELNTPFTRRYSYVLWMVRYYVYAGSACGIFAIVGTRLHYTLDVLIAVYITAQVWFTYHWLCAHPKSAFKVLNWLEHEEVHFIDLDAYRKARRSFTIEKSERETFMNDKED